jgi:hypothetical protein
MTLEGSRGENVVVEGFFEPFPTFVVSRIVEVVDKQSPKLHGSFAARANWRLRNAMSCMG